MQGECGCGVFEYIYGFACQEKFNSKFREKVNSKFEENVILILTFEQQNLYSSGSQHFFARRTPKIIDVFYGPLNHPHWVCYYRYYFTCTTSMGPQDPLHGTLGVHEPRVKNLCYATLTSKVVKSDLKIIISLDSPEPVAHSVHLKLNLLNRNKHNF